jgi:hypothetical protein
MSATYRLPLSLGVLGDLSVVVLKLSYASLFSLLAFLYKAKREHSTVKHEELSFFSRTDVCKNKIAVVR